MEQAILIQKCIFLNATLLLIILICICWASEKSNYMRIGPNDSLSIIGIHIDTWNKYYVCNLIIASMQCVDMIISDLAMPILNFTIFNPDKIVITEFGKNELQVYAQLMWIMTSIRTSLMVLVTISQIDIALLKIIFGELASCFSVRLLLNKKVFTK